MEVRRRKNFILERHDREKTRIFFFQNLNDLWRHTNNVAYKQHKHFHFFLFSKSKLRGRSASGLSFKVGARIQNIQILKTFEFQTFWRSIFKWFRIWMVKLHVQAWPFKGFYRDGSHFFLDHSKTKWVMFWSGDSKSEPFTFQTASKHSCSKRFQYLSPHCTANLKM